MKLAYTPIHPKVYLFSGVFMLSLLVFVVTLTRAMEGIELYVVFAVIYSLVFYKVNFYDYVEIKDDHIYIPSVFVRRKFDLKGIESFKSISNNELVFLHKNEEKVINLGCVNQIQIIEFENILENYGLKRI